MLPNRTATSSKKIDLHVHTRFSDGRGEVEDVVKMALKKELKLIAITDHYSEYQPLPMRMSSVQLQDYLRVLEGNAVLKGVEVEILADGTPSISKKTVACLNVVLAGLHILHDRVFWGLKANSRQRAVH